MAYPIWRDTYVDISGIGALSYVDFAILYEGNVIYEGRAYPKSGAQSVEIKINDICANYLANTLPTIFPNAGAEAHAYTYVFTVQYTAYFNGEVIDVAEEGFAFAYDWSYDRSRIYDGTATMLAPILRKVPLSAPLLFTTTTGANGTVYTTEGDEPLALTDNANIVLGLPLNATRVAVRTADTAPLVEYEVVGDCYRYMLYYLNAFGGWEFLLIEGKELMTDDYTRHTFGRAYDNNLSRNRGIVNYRNDIARRWDLRTLWIDDAGAQNIHHLLGSTDVYLYDMKSGELHPITLTNSSCEYRTYSNNGNQLVRYDIEASLAQHITRR